MSVAVVNAPGPSAASAASQARGRAARGRLRRRWVRVSRVGVLAFLLALAGTLFCYGSITWNQSRGYSVREVVSESMVPTLVKGDVVRVDSSKTPTVGEIGTYVKADGRTVIHRVVDTPGGVFIFRGDANSVDDAPVEASTVSGRYDGLMRPQWLYRAYQSRVLAGVAVGGLLLAGAGRVMIGFVMRPRKSSLAV